MNEDDNDAVLSPPKGWLPDSGRQFTASTAAGNRLLSTDTEQFEYDKEGNLTRRTDVATGEQTRYAWDSRNRLTFAGKYASSAPGAALLERVDLKYDNLDQLIEKRVTVGTNPAVVERYAWQNGQRTLTLDGAGSVLRRHHWGPGTDALLADEVFGWSFENPDPFPELYWTAADHLGTVRDVVDQQGELANHLEYDEHGVITHVVDGAKENVPLAERAVEAAFAGREFVDELGLYYNRRRWYDPANERFLSEDPAQADPNLYRYAANDPVNFADPTGLRTQSVFETLPAFRPLGSAPPSFPSFAAPNVNLAGGLSSYSTPGSGFNAINEYLNQTPTVASISPLPSATYSNYLGQQVAAPRSSAPAIRTPRQPAEEPGFWSGVANAISNYPHFLGTELAAAGKSIVNTGRSLGDFAGDHLSMAYYDPQAELNRARQGRDAFAHGIANAAIHIYNDPSGAAVGVGRATVNYPSCTKRLPTTKRRQIGSVDRRIIDEDMMSSEAGCGVLGPANCQIAEPAHSTGALFWNTEPHTPVLRRRGSSA